MSKETKFKNGDVVSHKTESPHKIVIMKVKWCFFGKLQKYKICWYDGNEYRNGIALEHELKI